MKFVFTVTQRGMTPLQKTTFADTIRALSASEFRHGDCIGADSDAHQIVLDLGIEIRIHPPIIEAKRAFCKGAIEVFPVKDYLARNKDIVNATEVLIATPGEFAMELRSGTWSTVRYGLKTNKWVLIIYPDGSIFDSKSSIRKSL